MPIQRLLRRQCQYLAQWDVHRAPFENQSAAGLEDSEALAESSAEHFSPVTDEASIFLCQQSGSFFQFLDVRRVEYDVRRMRQTGMVGL